MSKEYLHSHVHHSTTHNCQGTESTQVSTSWWMGKRSVPYLHNGVLLRMNESGGQYTNCTEGQMLHDFTYIENGGGRTWGKDMGGWI
jgi:hypothetical protein